MPKFKLGKKAKDAFMLPISLPSGLVDLKGHCKVNDVMSLSDEEAAFALKNGLQKYIDQEFAAIVNGDVKPAKPTKPAEEVKKPEPKKEEVREPVVEAEEEVSPVEVETIEEASDSEADTDESQEEKGKSSKKRSKKG